MDFTGKSPCLSVFIPADNATATLRQTVRAVLDPTYRHLEWWAIAQASVMVVMLNFVAAYIVTAIAMGLVEG